MTRVDLVGLSASAVGLRHPRMRVFEQRFTAQASMDVERATRKEWGGDWYGDVEPGARAAIAVGSRGIDGLESAAEVVVSHLRRKGSRTFIGAAMGSQGNATAAGQRAVLIERWVTDASVGDPSAPPEAASFGKADGLPPCADGLPTKADGLCSSTESSPTPALLPGSRAGSWRCPYSNSGTRPT